MQLDCSKSGGAVIALFEEEDSPVPFGEQVTVPIPGATDDQDVVTLEFDSAGHLVAIILFDHQRLLPSVQAQADWFRRT